MSDNITSARDLGFQFAAAIDHSASLALLARDVIPGFPDDVPEGGWDDFNAGCLQRKADITPARLFVREGVDTYREITGQKAPKGADTLSLDVAYAMSFSQQQAGALKKHQPNLHRMVSTLRTDANKYLSNTRRRLVATFKAVTAGPRDRAHNKSFTEWLDDTVAAIVKKAKRCATTESNPALTEMKTIREMVLARLK